MLNTKILSIFASILILMLAAAFFSVAEAADKLTISIIPNPAELSTKDGSFILTRNTIIVTEHKTRRIGEYLSGYTAAATGLTPAVKTQTEAPQTPGAVLLKIDSATAEQTGSESYELSISPNGIDIRGATPAAVFYGVQTLRQLLPVKPSGGDVKIPCVEIRDTPRFPWRGLMLDTARHFFPKESVLKFIDVMAAFKFNRLHLHLVDDQGWRLEMKKYPQLTEIGAWRKKSRGADYAGFNGATGPAHGGFYTQDDIREIVAYAADRFITALPEIEMPGHSTAAIASMRNLHCTGEPVRVRTQWGISGDIYCAGKEETFEFLENVLTETMELFSGEYIHIGGDEAPKDRWRKCPKCQARIRAEGLKDEDELQSWFIARIEKFVHGKGKKIIGWDEILEGGLPPRATVMSWRGTKGGTEAAIAGHDVIMSPNKHCYLNKRYYEADEKKVAWQFVVPFADVYRYDPAPEELTTSQAAHILGVQGAIWTEFIPTYDVVEYMAYPRALAVAEVGWTQKNLKNWNDFLDRLENVLPQLDMMGVNYRKDIAELER